jgi:hyperosmotically inducible protein
MSMQDKRKLALYGASLAVMVALAGCMTNKAPKDERSEGRITDDKNITQHVNNALKQEPVYKFDGVDVQTFAGIVQLSGFVNVEEQRQRALELASRQEGVIKVVNSLAIKPQMAATGHPTTEQHIYSGQETNQNWQANPNQPK